MTNYLKKINVLKIPGACTIQFELPTKICEIKQNCEIISSISHLDLKGYSEQMHRCLLKYVFDRIFN